MKSYEAFLFDPDNTLCQYEETDAHAFKAVLQSLHQHTKIEQKEIKEQFLIARRELHETLGDTAAARNRFLYFQLLPDVYDFNTFSKLPEFIR